MHMSELGVCTTPQVTVQWQDYCRCLMPIISPYLFQELGEVETLQMSLLNQTLKTDDYAGLME